MDIEEKAKKISLLVLDVDGVMTDGAIVYDDAGGELKYFDSRDGHGIKMLMRTGVDVAIITGRMSAAVGHRAANLGISTVYQKALNKIDAYAELAARTGRRDDEVCCMGDDLPDLPVMRRAGLSVAVPDAVEEVRRQADYITRHAGGRGAVREICELIMKAQGTWQAVTARYFLQADPMNCKI